MTVGSRFGVPGWNHCFRPGAVATSARFGGTQVDVAIRTICFFLVALALTGCAIDELPAVESDAWLSDVQQTEMARQYLSMLPDSLRNGSTIKIDNCIGGLGVVIDARRGVCDYYISHVVDQSTWGARVFSECNKDQVCLFRMEPYEQLGGFN